MFLCSRDHCTSIPTGLPVQIMKLVNDTPAEQRPKVLGLTASIINKKVSPSQLEAKIESLQNSMGCAVSTVHDMEAVNKWVTRVGGWSTQGREGVSVGLCPLGGGGEWL